MTVTNHLKSARQRWQQPLTVGEIFAAPAKFLAVLSGPASTQEKQVGNTLPPRGDPRWPRTLAPILLALLFWVDTQVPPGVAVHALYVAPALLFLRTGRFWEPLLVAFGASLATIAGSYLSAPGGSIEIGQINRPLELVIVWVSAGLVAYHRIASNRWSAHFGQKQHALQETVVRLEELRYALDQAAIVAATDHRGAITYVNDKFCEISKYSRAELLGEDHRIINSGYHSKEFMRALWRTVAQGHVWRGEIRNRAKDGRFYWVDTTIVPFLDDRGKPRQYLAIRSDITQRKAAEAKLAEQAALTQLGQLAAVVAHEVRNPLAGLRGTLEILRSRIGATPRDRDVIQVMIERIDTLNAKVSDILRFARPQAPVLQAVEVSAVIDEAVTAACASISGATPEVVFTRQTASARADAEMLRAALLNLLLNACQAGATRVDIQVLSDGGVCRVEICDNGSGIPADAIPHIFEAFYTTKKTGTGLGLPIVKRLMDLQNGAVMLKAREGGGTVAEITLSLTHRDVGNARETVRVPVS